MVFTLITPPVLFVLFVVVGSAPADAGKAAHLVSSHLISLKTRRAVMRTLFQADNSQGIKT